MSQTISSLQNSVGTGLKKNNPVGKANSHGYTQAKLQSKGNFKSSTERAHLFDSFAL